MNEYERILGIVRAKNQTSIELNPRGTALIVVDMQRYYTQPSFPFTEICEKLSPGSSVGYLNRVRETVIPNNKAIEVLRRQPDGWKLIVGDPDGRE